MQTTVTQMTARHSINFILIWKYFSKTNKILCKRINSWKTKKIKEKRPTKVLILPDTT